MSKMIIRAKSFRAWMQSNFSRTQLKDIANHGADSGWAGLTYYGDTCKLYARFKEEIWDMATENSESLGNKNVFEFISSFRRADVGNCEQFENLMVWYAAEKVSQELTE